MATKQAGDGCYASALPHEEMFVLLARDESAPAAIDAWVDARIKSDKNKPSDPEIIEALRCAERMEEQRAEIRRELGK